MTIALKIHLKKCGSKLIKIKMKIIGINYKQHDASRIIKRRLSLYNTIILTNTFYRPLSAQSASSGNGIRHRSRRYRLTSDNQSGKHEYGTSSIGPSRTACHRIRSRHSKPGQYRTPAFQRDGTGTEQGRITCHTHQPFLRIRMDCRTAMLPHQELF